MPRKRYYTRKRADWKPAFLAALAQTGLVNKAAEIAGISPGTAHRARELKDRKGANLAAAQRFAEAWDNAIQNVADFIETEIFRRAIHGTEQPYDVFYKGEKIGTQVYRNYSDRLLIVLAKAYRPERYGRHWGLPGQPESAPLPEEAPINLLKETQELAQQRWDELRPLVARRLAALQANTSIEIIDGDQSPESKNATPPPTSADSNSQFPPESTAP